ncbi:MAG: ATP-binding protein [Parachlamydiales bacterium]|nr:ATP-binding protein [Parachlamydiales bacterium]
MKRSLEKELIKWKDDKMRHPLLLRGARQVGKTYLVESFGKSKFESFVSVNFEAQPEAIACFDNFDPEKILYQLQLTLKESIIPGKTLLFLDEIQACPKAIMSLRYFKEKLPSLHVIGASSLLEFALVEGKFSFPVGRIQFMYLKPFSFEEYINARKKTEILEEIIKNQNFEKNLKLHEEMISLVKEYFLVGGMPAAVSNFCENFDFEKCFQIHEILLSTYQADFSKYSTKTIQKYLKTLFTGIFPLITQQFKYSKIDAHMRARELKQALDHLEWAGLIYPIYVSNASGLPLASQAKKTLFKTLFLDIGLVQHALKIDPKVIFEKDIILINRGALAEQFVGQELLAYTNPFQEGQLYYWQKAKKTSDAEIDYLYTIDHHIIPIEVKAGPHGRLKSLYQFMKEKKSIIGIHISQNPLSYENNILSVPFYLISKLPTLLKQILKEK